MSTNDAHAGDQNYGSEEPSSPQPPDTNRAGEPPHPAVPKTPVEPGREGDLLTRLLDLERQVRVLQGVLEVRNEAFGALMERLITAERLVYHRDRELREANAERERVAAERERLAAEQERLAAEQERLAVERDNALALANALQNLRLFRYTRAPRAVYGFLLRFVRRRRV